MTMTMTLSHAGVYSHRLSGPSAPRRSSVSPYHEESTSVSTMFPTPTSAQRVETASSTTANSATAAWHRTQRLTCETLQSKWSELTWNDKLSNWHEQSIRVRTCITSSANNKAQLGISIWFFIPLSILLSVIHFLQNVTESFAGQLLHTTENLN